MKSLPSQFGLRRLLVLVGLVCVVLACYRSYIDDKKFGLKPGVTTLPTQSGAISCGFELSDQRFYIRGPDDIASSGDLD